MGLFSRDIQTFDDLYLHTLRDIYYAENQITKALPKMIKKAADPKLKQGLETHLGRPGGGALRNHALRYLRSSVRWHSNLSIPRLGIRGLNEAPDAVGDGQLESLPGFSSIVIGTAGSAG
jgi:hypothetical protein